MKLSAEHLTHSQTLVVIEAHIQMCCAISKPMGPALVHSNSFVTKVFLNSHANSHPEQMFMLSSGSASLALFKFSLPLYLSNIYVETEDGWAGLISFNFNGWGSCGFLNYYLGG